MATENIVIGPIDDDAEEESPRSSFWEGLRGLLSTGATYNDAEENDLRYERRIWDKRIESFLDSHLPDYIHDFGILDEITLRVREERTSDLETRSHELVAFVRALDAELSGQESRLSAVEKLAPKKRTGA